MVKWTKPIPEVIQLITADGETFDLTSESKKGNWVLYIDGCGMPDIDYFAQIGPFQHGESVRDYRLKPRTVNIELRQQACDRDDYWDRRTELLNALRPNRDETEFTGVWIARSQYQYQDANIIDSLIKFKGKLYGGAGPDGMLFEWIANDKWYKVASQLNAQDYILSMIVYDDGGGDDELYAGTSTGGRLFKWDGVSAWSQVCAQLNGQTHISDLAIFDDGLGGGDQIFAGTSGGGRLFHYNVGGGAWAQDCAQLNAETWIQSLCVYDDGGGNDLYGGTYPNGKLYRYNPAGPAWVEVCAQLNGQFNIWDLVVYNGQLYGCTDPGGRLFRYDVAGGHWDQVAGLYGTSTYLYKLVVFQGRLYASGYTGELLRWNNSDAWEAVTDVYGNEITTALYVYNNRLFAGTDAITGVDGGAYLLEYLNRAGETTVPCLTLRRILSDGSIRDLCVFIDKGAKFNPTKRGWDEHGFMENIRLIAPDPVFYDPTEQDGPTYTMDPAATGIVNESQTVTYAGTWQEHPIFVITGPINKPIIRNEDTDESIQLDYDIADGRIVTITLTPGNQTVEDDLGVNLIGAVTTDSDLQRFHLATDPEVTDGDNEINIQGTGTNANTDFSFTYYNRYIGI